MIRSAAAGRPTAAADLFEGYRGVVERYARRQGLDAASAEDLAQEVFLRLFTAGVLERARPERGRFRSLLLGTTRNVLGHRRARTGAQRRGGERRALSLNDTAVAGMVDSETRADRDEAFDREWLAMLLAVALKRLRAEHPDYYRSLHASAVLGHTHRRMASEHGLTEAAVRNQVSRGRARLARLFQEEACAHASPSHDFAEELRYLASLLGGRPAPLNY